MVRSAGTALAAGRRVMKLKLYCIGKATPKYLETGIADYADRIQRYLPLTQQVYKEAKDTAKPQQQEGRQLLSRIQPQDYVVALDEQGDSLSSRELADFLNKHMLHGTAALTWLIGGAYGLAAEVKQQAHKQLCLSPMTLPHGLARLLLLEQLYRGLTIVRGEPYHNG